jgi:hypothetical protein
VPYPIAHPAAVLPLVLLLGRRAVPSALVIGSLIPDAWYFVPFAERSDSHSLAGLFVFCLPLGLGTYLLFHLFLKAPLLALAPPALAARLAAFHRPGLPRAPWPAVLLCLLAGAATHLAWDAFAHAYGSFAQHGSTILGTALLGAWVWSHLARAPAGALPAHGMPAAARHAIVAALVFTSGAWALWVALQAGASPPWDYIELRRIARAAGIAGAEAFALGLFAYCAARSLLVTVGGVDLGPQRVEKLEHAQSVAPAAGSGEAQRIQRRHAAGEPAD